ncbi:BTB/POZ and MATH domain-containing protein 2-like [Lolium perenne]|uniref:BTB/POZ and MATH domain-containing protein 2-like n=1 Tax=Lolium perenne TaxID=4522 RepID=UPI0021F5FFDF|nr:BTB/POZ and MATH domain-containing protein 2-like [Lolium perenne]
MPSMSAAMSALRAAGRQHLSASKFVPKFVERQVTGSHVFQIDKYAQARRMMPHGEKMRSDAFSVGGHDWRVECYPNGLTGNYGFISLYLTHASHAKTGDATASFRFSILDQSCWKPSCIKLSDDHYRFSDTPSSTHLSWSWGFGDFIKHEDLDKEKHLKNDRLMLLCDVTVAGLRDDDHAVAEVEPASPPVDLHGPLGEAIWNTEKPDMEIEAGGVTFPVHRRVLEARSPVFKADLSLAPAAGEGAAALRIDDMDADVCKALLRFIYDEIPSTDLLATAGMAERLLIAADRYKVEKLKHICEKALLPSVSLSSVADTLALAERHHCPELREACMRFLSSRDNILALAETDDFEKMKKDCPSALLELFVK